MKLKNMFILLFILGIADSFITYVFPVDFTFQSMSFVPHIAFMALLLVTYDRKSFNLLFHFLFYFFHSLRGYVGLSMKRKKISFGYLAHF